MVYRVPESHSSPATSSASMILPALDDTAAAFADFVVPAAATATNPSATAPLTPVATAKSTLASLTLPPPSFVYPAASLTSSSSTSSLLSSASSVSSPLVSPSSSSSLSAMGDASQPPLGAVLSEHEAEDGSVEDSGDEGEESEQDEAAVQSGAASSSASAQQVARRNAKRAHTDLSQPQPLASLSVPSSPIPSFTSSSEPSSSPPSLSPRDGVSVGPPRRRRRKISDLGQGEIWECPLYLCHKRYKKTSIQSIALHKAKCGSRPQLQQLMSQQEEQLHKDRLLQQQSRQLHEQQVMLNRQQEEQQRQMMALENARQALLLMQQQQQQQQQVMQRPPTSAGPFHSQPSFGLVPTAPFASMSPSNQLAATGSTAPPLPLQQFSLNQSMSYPLITGPLADSNSPSSSSLVSTQSPVTQSTGAPVLQSPPLMPLTVSGAPHPPSAQRSNGTELLYPPNFNFTQHGFVHPSLVHPSHMQHQQLPLQQQLPHQQLQQQHQQPQHTNPPWHVSFPMAGAGQMVPQMNNSSVTVSNSQPMPVGAFGPLVSVLPLHSPLAVHLATQHAQQGPSLHTIQPPTVVTSPPLPVHPHQLVLQQQQQQQFHAASPHWFAGASHSVPSSLPIHFVSTQATSMFVTSPSLSSSTACGTLPLSIGPSSRPSSQSPATASFTSPLAASSPDKTATVAGSPPLILSNVSPLSSLPALPPLPSLQ